MRKRKLEQYLSNTVLQYPFVGSKILTTKILIYCIFIVRICIYIRIRIRHATAFVRVQNKHELETNIDIVRETE